MTVSFVRKCGWAGEISVEVLAAMNLETFDSAIATLDNVATGLRVLDESFRISLILGGTFVALLAVLVLLLSFSLLLTELQKARP